MAMQSDSNASPAAFAGADALAMSSTNALVLIGRILLGWLFLMSGWPKVMSIAGFTGYLTNLGAPEFLAWPAALAEVLIGVTLILGIATRYMALVTFIYVIIATALAHRYWTYPAAAQGNQYNHFLKNIAIMGGSLLLFATGAGRFSIDAMMRGRGP